MFSERRGFKQLSPGIFLSLVLLLSSSAVNSGSFTSPENLNPESADIRLDTSFQDDAWVVYTYAIDEQGRVADAQIRSSNGVTRVESAVLAKLSMMRFAPATRDGQPVKVAADPVIFTWILDLPRAMSPQFNATYQAAWALFKEGNYDGAFDLAVRLKDMPGRNALEEVRYQVLAASLASRRANGAAELQHLGRAVELQALAGKNNFKHHYIEADQYLLILERIQTLQLERMMLADAAATLGEIQVHGAGTDITVRAAAAYSAKELEFNARQDVTVSAELVPVYRDGPGAWKIGLSRYKFSISDVKGKVHAVFLVCGPRDIQLRYPSVDPCDSRWSEVLPDRCRRRCGYTLCAAPICVIGTAALLVLY